MKRKITALILALVLLLSQSSVFAVGLDVTEDTVSDVAEPEILAEDVSKRDEFEKHYIRSDGTYVAVTYDNAVHYMDSEGVWQDVDNKVIYNAKSGKYITSTPAFNAEFSSPTSSGSLVTVKNGGRTLAWGLSVVTPNKVTAGDIVKGDAITPAVSNTLIPSAEVKNASVSDTDEIYDLKNAVGGIGYTNIFSNAAEISVDYSVSHNRIEEDIYINSPTDATAFKMELYIGELVAAVNSDGSVSIRDSEGNEEYRIGIPYMADANDAVLTNIDVTVTQNGSYCTVTYTPDRNWLTSEDRAYPILFDPSITTSEYAANVHDTYVYQGNTANHSGEQRLYIGVMNSKIYRTYINFGKLPSIDSTMPIISASLTFTMHYTTTTGKTTGLYKVLEEWNQNSITYANEPMVSTSRIGTSAYNASTNKHVFNVTDDVINYYTNVGSEFWGYQFRYIDETLTNPDYNSNYSSEVSTRAYRPALTVSYGYSLPSNLELNKEYYFENAFNYTYLTVCGGVDANDVNVCMAYPNGTASQKFKLVQAANGGYYIRAVCSSNNRVLDIYKNDATGYVENGCNVQIYNPTDPLAQEWFIVGTGYEYFRIIPRTDMTLSLVANELEGTADGRSSSSQGNVYVANGGGNSTWHIIDASTNQKVTYDSFDLSNATYYLNNDSTGKYLNYNTGVSTPFSSSGLLADLGTNIHWSVKHVGNNTYTVRWKNGSNAYLYVNPQNGDLRFGAISEGSSYGNYLWEISRVAGQGYIFRNVGSNRYLCDTGSVVALPEDDKYSYIWRCENIYTYGDNFEYTDRELQYATMSLMMGKNSLKSPSVVPYPGTAIWSDPDDFYYESSDTAKLTCYGSVFETHGKSGEVTVTATHKVTNDTTVFTVYIAEFDEGTHLIREYDEEDDLLIELDPTEDGKMEMRELNGSDLQRWNFVYAGGGYYAIISEENEDAITCPSGASNKTALQTAEYEHLDRQKWAFIKEGDGFYIKPKSAGSSELYMGIEQRTPFNDGQYHDLQLRNSDSKELWSIFTDFIVLDEWNAYVDNGNYVTGYDNEVGYWDQIPQINCYNLSNMPDAQYEQMISNSCYEWGEAIGRTIQYSMRISSELTSVPTNGYTCILLDKDDFYSLTGYDWDEYCNSTTVGYCDYSDDLSFFACHRLDDGTYTSVRVLKITQAVCYIIHSTDEDVLHNTILHEMGHGFGYIGHAAKGATSFVMNPNGNDSSTLYGREKTHLGQIYDIVDNYSDWLVP